MSSSLAIILALLLKALNATPTQQNPQCSELLKSAGATDKFGANVGHSIHSINVRALQRFNPSASEKNRVPTVNLNLTSDEALLPYAPDHRGPSDGKFLTDGMKVLDQVLSQMDNPMYGLKFFTPLEKVVHAFHMEESWAMAHHEYTKIQQNPPSIDVCKCAMDIENNGVLKMLRYVALCIREPQLIAGNSIKANQADVGRIKFDYGQQDQRMKPASDAEVGRIKFDYGQQDHDMKASNAEVGRMTFDYGQRDSNLKAANADVGRIKFDYGQKDHDMKSPKADDVGRIKFDYGQQDQSMKTSNAEVGRMTFDYGQRDSQRMKPASDAEVGRIKFDYGQQDHDMKASNAEVGRMTFDYGQRDSNQKASNAEVGRIKFDYGQQDHGMKASNTDVGRIKFDYDQRDSKAQAEQSLLDSSQTMPYLTNTKAWEEWKTIIGSMRMEDHFDTALFLFCAFSDRA